MLKITLNDIAYRVPSSWKEVTVKQYMRILKEWDPEITDVAQKDWVKLLNIFTGANFSSMSEKWENQYTLTNALSWVVFEPFTFSKELPKVLLFDGRPIDIPRHPTGLSIGQNIHLRRDYLDKSQTVEENIAIATAIFLQPIIDGKKFSMSRAIELCAEIEQMPIYLIYPIGFFFLRNAQRLGATSGRTWRQTLSNLNTRFGRMWRSLPRLVD